MLKKAKKRSDTLEDASGNSESTKHSKESSKVLKDTSSNSDSRDDERAEHSKNSSEELEDAASNSESTEHSKETTDTSKDPSKKSKTPVSNCRIFFWFGKISSIYTINITNHHFTNITLRSNRQSQAHP